MRLNGNQHLLVVVAAAIVAAWFAWPYCRDAMHQIDHQLHNKGGALAADDTPRPYQRSKCTGSIRSNQIDCGEPPARHGRR
jgi:hypothetical protein